MSAVVLMVLYSLIRLALLIYNRELAAALPTATLAEAFFNGLRFDLRLTVYACIPLILATMSNRAMAARRFHILWLTLFASATGFLGMVELDFYREFHQRLNSLVFQYISEDPKTVLSMLWYGFPVVRYLLAWLLTTWVLMRLFQWLDKLTSAQEPVVETYRPAAHNPLYIRITAFALVFIVAVVAARGTLDQGPPLRWGAAFTTDSLFVNQLGLNASLSLLDAAKSAMSDQKSNIWKSTLPQEEALSRTREMILLPEDRLIDQDQAALRRITIPDPNNALPIRHVVVILMESFAGRYVGALGATDDITPYFDALSKEGLLFRRYFSNGTHTHQGMFATMACFPNLPGFEYLMQQPEGAHLFSSLPQLLGPKGFDNLYVYNGDFAWDNQQGFFGGQGMTNFIGRHDFVNPVFSDPTWGVSDQDMFDRAYEELSRNYGKKPFYALLQTLSNHTPYALPEKLPVTAVTDHGSLNEHLTAMRYSDWALGQFFEKARTLPYFNETLFVIIGDHGFGAPEQLTDMDLYRYHVPLLLIAPGIQQKFGTTSDKVGTQIDVVPTILGRLGQPTQHQCWGRDLLSAHATDPGFGVIKPSGGGQTVAIIDDDQILVQPKAQNPTLFRYSLHEHAGSQRVDDSARSKSLRLRLEAFLQVATDSLQNNTAGAQAKH